MKMPGVATKIRWAAPSMAMPRTSVRVVCTLGDTIETLAPTTALSSVDFPTFGAPIRATKPQRVGASAVSAIEPFGFDALARHHRGRGGLVGRALGASGAFGGGEIGKLHGDAELRVVIRTGARDLAIGGGRQAARLRPFLEHGFWIALRLRLGLQAGLPQAPDQGGCGRRAAVRIRGADKRLADIRENRRPGTGARIALRRAKPDRRAEIDGARDFSARLLAHEIGEPARKLALVRARESTKEHVENDKAEHVIAEELEPLVACRAVARAFERGDVRKRAVEQRGVGESIADAFLEQAVAATATTSRILLAVSRRDRRRSDGGRGVQVAQKRALRRSCNRCGFAPAAHLTSENRRCQRTVQGQRHTSRACPPLTEKKMICALPMMFS